MNASEETPKRSRKGSKVEGLPTESETPAREARTDESGAASHSGNGAATPTVSWNDVVKASAEVEASRIEREVLEDVIDVKLTESDVADIARANAADDHEKTARQRTVDDLKGDLKDEKSAIEAIDARMRDRNNAVRRGSQSRKAKWIVESIFATNTARYLDPDTERVVHERPLRGDERQVKLPLISDDAAARAAQLSLGDAADATDITDAEGLLGAANGSPSSSTPEDGVSDENENDDSNDDEDGEL